MTFTILYYNIRRKEMLRICSLSIRQTRDLREYSLGRDKTFTPPLEESRNFA